MVYLLLIACLALNPAPCRADGGVGRSTLPDHSGLGVVSRQTGAAMPNRPLSPVAKRAVSETLENRRLLNADAGGLTGTYYGTPDFSGPGLTRLDETVNFYWGRGAPADGLPDDRFSVRWEGQITPEFSETYSFMTRTDEAVRLWVDGQLIIDAWDGHKLASHWGNIDLRAGEPHELKMEFRDDASRAAARLLWTSASQVLEDVPTAALSPKLTKVNVDYHDVLERIEVEDFDFGGAERSYRDLSVGNAGASYRDGHVDIQRARDAGGGHNVGWTTAGEWLDYTFEVLTPGRHRLDLRVASGGPGGTFNATIDGADAFGSLAVPDTGGWQKWRTITAGEVELSAGVHTLRLAMAADGPAGFVGNFNWLAFAPITPVAPPPPPAKLPPDISVTRAGNALVTNGSDVQQFGTATVGDEPPSATFVVRNDGEADLLVSELAIPQGFQVSDGLLGLIPAGGSDTMTLLLPTATAGTVAGNVTVTSNDPDEAAFTFGILGTVAEEPPAPPAAVGRAIVPGPGFAGPTAQPARVGTGQFSDAKAIARWDVVPHQTFTGKFNVGVVAFHAAGIDRVEFSVDGGDWVSVNEMTLNPRAGGNGWDGVWEYWATIDAADFADAGPITVRAVAYPTVGDSRVLEDLPLNVDPDGQIFANRPVRYVSLNGSNSMGDGTRAKPFATIKQAAMDITAERGDADNGLIYMLEGDYAYSGGWEGPGWHTPNTEQAWLTITPAPGVGREQVRITDGGRLNASRVHLKDLTLMKELVSSTDLNQPSKIWWDGALLTAGDQHENLRFAAGFDGGSYLTNSTVTRVMNGPTGVSLSRGNRMIDLGSDAFQNVEVLINGHVDGIDRGETGAHPDVLQYQGGSEARENNIFYGLTTKNLVHSQGLFLSDVGGLKDIAIVNLQIDAGNNLIGGNGPADHIVVWNNTFSHNLFFGNNTGITTGTATGWSVRNNYMRQAANMVSVPAGNMFDNNHFVLNGTFGTNATEGDVVFGDNWKPLPNSALARRLAGVESVVPADASGAPTEPGATTYVGAFKATN